MGLTEDQKKRIEENRLKALAKRKDKPPPGPPPTGGPRMMTPSPSASAAGHITSNFSNSTFNRFASSPTLLQSGSGPLKAKPLTTPFSSPTPSAPKVNPVSQATFYGSGNSSNVQSSTKPGITQATVRTVKGQCVLVSADHFKVDIVYHVAVINVFKSIPSAKYNASDRQWLFNISDHEDLIRQLRPLRPEVEIDPLPKIVVNVLDKNRNKRKEVFVNTDQEGSFVIEPSLWDALMPFQREGVVYALQRSGRIILADDMGLGKTIQALSVACAYRSEWPFLIVCPSSMRFAWKAAILKWVPSIPKEDILVITGGKDFLCDVQVIVINYDLLSKKQTELVARKMKLVIFDESHFLKNHKSLRCKAADAISRNANRLILLSGTPALSRPMELYSQISMVDRTLYPNPIDFGMRYCNGRKISFGSRDGYDFSGSSNMHELRLVLEERCMVRRMKTDVITQLPPKLRQVIELDPTVVTTKNKVLQTQAKQMMASSLSNSEKRGILLQWFHTTADAKKKAVQEYIKDLLEGGKKFICFAHHQVMMDSIGTLLEDQKVDYIRIDGSTSGFLREQFCKEFQTMDSKRVALLSITAANAGITLTAAQLVIFAELFWNPGILIQAEDRAHRIGQTSSVTVQYLVATGTADDELWPMIQNKLEVLSKVGLSNQNFIKAESKSVQHKAKVSDGAASKITDYFSTSFTEEELEQIFADDSFGMEDLQPEEKRPKL